MFSEYPKKAPKEEAIETPPYAARPFGRAGLFDVDPPQTGVSQDPSVIVVGDVDSLPEEV